MDAERSKQMKKTGKLMEKEVNKLVDIINNNFFLEQKIEINDYCFEYLKRKIKNKPLRAYFSQKIFRYISFYQKNVSNSSITHNDESDLFEVIIPFVFEVVVIIQYLHNHILDEKNNSNSRNYKVLNQKLISANILKEGFYIYLDLEVKSKLSSLQDYHFLLNKIRHLFITVDIGQFIEKTHNTYSSWKEENTQLSIDASTPDFDGVKFIDSIQPLIIKNVEHKNKFVNNYLLRIYHTNVYFFKCIVEILIQLTKEDSEKIKNNLISFSVLYGFMLQFVNDIKDFAYPPRTSNKNGVEEKIEVSDFFSDLYNFNVTLPLIYFLNTKNIDTKTLHYLVRVRKSKQYITKNKFQIIAELKTNGSFNQCREVCEVVAEMAMHEIDMLNPQAKFLKDMCEISRKNKYFLNLYPEEIP